LSEPATPPVLPAGCRILFAGGGTGGHLFPGIAIADRLRELQPACEILFVGSNRALEQQILNETPYRSESLSIVSARYALRQPIRFARNWRASRHLAYEILAQFQPQLVVGLGGFASYPILKQAGRKRIPTLLLEQNAVPGRVTSLCAKQASRICLSYEEAGPYLPRQASAVVTGNPIRVGLFSRPDQETNSRNILVICGGSQGSQVINQAILKYFSGQHHELHNWHIRHQTGGIDDNFRQQLATIYEQQTASFEIRPFFRNPAELYANASVLIGRAGGTTLAEVAALNIPALVIPIANSVRNHQLLNAQAHLKRYPGFLISERATDFDYSFAEALNSLALTRSHTNSSPSASETTNAVDRVIDELARLLLPSNHKPQQVRSD